MESMCHVQGMVRFDDPCVKVGAAVSYFREHMARKDYLSQNDQQELVWIGKGSKQLGLTGIVREKDFARRCEGRHPKTGEKLGVREKDRCDACAISAKYRHRRMFPLHCLSVVMNGSLHGGKRPLMRP